MEFLKNLGIILSFVAGTAIPFIIAIVGKIKEVKAAKKAALEAQDEAALVEAQKRKAEAENAIRLEIKKLVQNAEASYKEIDAMLKQKGSSAGAMKKHSVMSDLKCFYYQHGYDWNEDEANAAVEEEVAYTKTVNAKA